MVQQRGTLVLSSTLFAVIAALVLCACSTMTFAMPATTAPAAPEAAPPFPLPAAPLPGEAGAEPDPAELAYKVRDGAVCFLYFLGGLAGITAIFFRRRLAGIFFFLACLFLAVEPIADYFIYHVIGIQMNSPSATTLAWSYTTINILSLVLAVGCLVGALFTAGKPKPRGQ